MLPSSALPASLREDIATFSDVQLIEETREAVGAQDAETALDLLTEMQRRGTGIFAAADRPSCEEVIDLPEGITDWKFRAVARQAYFRVRCRGGLKKAPALASSTASASTPS